MAFMNCTTTGPNQRIRFLRQGTHAVLPEDMAEYRLTKIPKIPLLKEDGAGINLFGRCMYSAKVASQHREVNILPYISKAHSIVHYPLLLTPIISANAL